MPSPASPWRLLPISTYGYTDARLRWGGVRDSGFGREHGTAPIENLTEPKVIWMNLNV